MQKRKQSKSALARSRASSPSSAFAPESMAAATSVITTTVTTTTTTTTTTIKPCRHGLLSLCDDCNVRECSNCHKQGYYNSFCKAGCSSRGTVKASEWRCALCRELSCCSGLRSCCDICRFCEQNIALRKNCQVCFEDFVARPSVLSCKHDQAVCGECMRTTVAVALQQGSMYVRCPALDCRHTLSQSEIQKWLTADLAAKYQRCLAELHAARLRQFDDKESIEWVTKNTKKCPKCFVLIEKNEGCMHMNCRVCGVHFQWDQTTRLGKEEFERGKREKEEEKAAKKREDSEKKKQKPKPKKQQQSTTAARKVSKLRSFVNAVVSLFVVISSVFSPRRKQQ